MAAIMDPNNLINVRTMIIMGIEEEISNGGMADLYVVRCR